MKFDKVTDFEILRTNYVIFRLKEFWGAKQEIVPRKFKEMLNSASYKISENNYLGMFFFTEDKRSMISEYAYSYSNLLMVAQSADGISNEMKNLISKSLDEFDNVLSRDIYAISKVKRLMMSIAFYTNNDFQRIGENILAEIYDCKDVKIISDGIKSMYNTNLYNWDLEINFSHPIEKNILKEILKKKLPQLENNSIYDINSVGPDAAVAKLNNFRVTLDQLHLLRIIARHY